MGELGKLEKTEDLKGFDVDKLRDHETANKFKVELGGKFEPLLRLDETSVEAMWQGIGKGFKSTREEVIEYRNNKSG